MSYFIDTVFTYTIVKLEKKWMELPKIKVFFYLVYAFLSDLTVHCSVMKLSTRNCRDKGNSE